jgi:hypothetical protein
LKKIIRDYGLLYFGILFVFGGTIKSSLKNQKTMKTKRTKWSITPVLLTVVLIGTSCASTTMIQSYPENAKVYINGEPVGRTPFAYTDTKISFSNTHIRLEKEGYEPVCESLCRDEQIDAGAVIGGLLFWYPFLWTFEYKPEHTYELEPLNGASDMAFQSAERRLTSSETDQLIQLKRLLDNGVLTPEEYEREKAEILGQE